MKTFQFLAIFFAIEAMLFQITLSSGVSPVGCLAIGIIPLICAGLSVARKEGK